MADNTLTGLLPTIYKAANKIMRAQVGFIPAVFLDPSAEMVAKNQTITYPIVATPTAGDIVPAATGPDPDAQTVPTGTMTIDKFRRTQFFWQGEEQKGVGSNYEVILQAQFEKAMSVLVNEVETDLFLAAKRNSSRATGTAGTTPFATVNNLGDFAELRKILADNGSPLSDLQLVINTTAGAKIRTVQAGLFKVNEAGSEELLRDANLGRVEGFNLRESNQIVSHTKGTGSLYVVNGAHAVGATSLVAKTGTGTVLAGDVVTLEDDTANKYMVNTGIAAAGTMVLGSPGLRQAQTDSKTITVGNSYTGNWGFDRQAIHLLVRQPAMPEGGDSADDVQVITDPFSGISFQVALYRQYRRISYEIALAWGVKVVNSESVATLLG